MDGTYDVFGNLDPEVIYLAKPGQRIINGLQGVREDTCYLEKNFNNTSVLEFTIDRDINGELNPTYDLVQQHYELYITHNGWFKINEEPVIESDGNVETKQVRAESLEIELQQYDIMDFEINTAAVSSKEMMAIDNVYEKDDYLMFHDRVEFYRDTSRLQELSETFAAQAGQTISDLNSYIYDYPEILNSWRINFDYSTIDTALQDTITEYRTAGQTYKANFLSGYVGTIHAGDTNPNPKIKTLTLINAGYPEILKHIHITVEQAYDPDDPSSAWYSIQEIIDTEIKREDELSLLTILLKEHGWNVGYIDITPRLAANGEYYTLAQETGQFQIDTQDIYSFITQDLANYFQCIFIFDTETYTVNAYRIESLKLDTNIYLSFHNIQNSITRNSDKQIYTVFNVLGGDDLHIDEANFGESWIEDISYFLNTDHFTQEFIDKYNYWQSYRDDPAINNDNQSNRQKYMKLSIERRKALEVATEIYDRVPVDGTDTYQYATMSDNELVEEWNKYNAILEGYRKTYIDQDGEYIGDEAFAEQYPRDYSDYYMIQSQVMPNIQIAIDNRQVSSASDTRDYLDNWKFDLDTYGLSYGVAELASVIQTFKNQIDTMEKRGQNVPGEQGDQYAQNNYQMYLKYVGGLESAQRAYNERLQEYNDAYDIYLDWNEQLQELKNDCALENEQFGFTEEELWLLDKYRIHTDYTNENIITTSISTSADWVNTAYQLYLDAKEQLSGESQPQWTFSTTQDNFLLMPEFKDWHGQLELGSYIRVAMREDYQVKLRVITIGFNPFLIEPTIDLQFSNMVQYAAKRDDFVSLLENGRSSGKNQISSALTSVSSTADINIDSGFLLKLINNGVFASYMTNFTSDLTGQVVGDVTTNAINAVSGNIGTIVSDQISSAYINVDHITGNTAEFNELFSKYIDTEYIVAEVMKAQDADIENLSARIIRVGEEGSGAITTITGDYIETNGINAQYINGDTASFNELTSKIINSDEIHALTIDASQITSGYAEFGELISQYITAQNITTESLTAAFAQITELQANSILSENAFVERLQSFTSTTVRNVANEAYITNIVANNMSVADLQAGNIVLSDNMKILSENGALVMNGRALQVIGQDSNGDDYVGVQLGYDNESQPSLILRNENGATVLTPEGITANAIADGLIINDMILQGTISKNRLGFSVMETGDTVQITQIYDGDTAWGVEYTNFQKATSEKLDQVSQELENQASYYVYIETPDGVNVRGGSVTLVAHLFRNNVDVTDDFPSSCFIWSRNSSDTAGDQTWNSTHTAHTYGAKELTISGADVNMTSSFECCFDYSYELTQDFDNTEYSVVDGAEITLSVAALGTTSYRWQWSNDGISWNEFPNNSGTYVITAQKALDGRMYRCYLSDGSTTISSKIATIHVSEE